jgi:CAAX prenyl protease-like protein
MSQPGNPADPNPRTGGRERRGRMALLLRHRWVPFILPLAVYLLVGWLEPTLDKPGGSAIGLAIAYEQYPLIYTLKIALSVAVLAFVWPAYREFPVRIVPLSILVGLVGAAIWIGLCRLDLEQRLLVPLLRPLGLDGLIAAGLRSGFDPLTQLADRPPWAWAFLTIRFFGLVAVVPVVEEMFYRGFLLRFVVRPNWWEVPPGKVNTLGVVLATLLPMAAHPPGELLAAAAWFSMITWLYVRTRSVWDCVAAHAVTNLLLGLYVVSTGEWQLM